MTWTVSLRGGGTFDVSHESKGDDSAFEVGLEGIKRVLEETEREGIVMEERRDERDGESGDNGESGGLLGPLRLLKREDRAFDFGLPKAATSGMESGGGVVERTT